MMWKTPFVAVLACLLAVEGEAHASPVLADDWGAEAAALYDATLDASQDGVTDAYLVRVARFGQTAARLGSWIDETGGAADFGCIFRGIAEEADLQVSVLETDAANLRPAMRRLAVMFSDAEAISAAAVHASVRSADHESGEAAGAATCPASAHVTHQYLTEQP